MLNMDNLTKTFRDFNHLLNSSLDETQVKRRAIEAMTAMMQSTAGTLFLLDGAREELYFDVAIGGVEGQLKEIRLKVGQGIAGWVAEHDKAQIVNDVQNDPRFSRDADHKSGFVTRNMLCAPVHVKGALVGVLQTINKKIGTFDDHDLDLLMSLSDSVGIALDNARLYKEVSEAFLSTVHVLTDAIEARDPYTGQHARRVMEYSLAIADSFNLSAVEREHLRFSSILHDIGKIGVDDAILRKPSRLDKAEREAMERHADIGASVLSSIQWMASVIPGVKHHHERYDGTGYPDRLKGEETPLAARIIAVVDTFDAMTTTRPYRHALPVETALAELEKCAGTQFDPAVTNAFLHAYESGKIVLSAHGIAPLK